jgi:2-amino-4-hydroxy-6-hydroxymethyldihydropteridine diphosphokinase
VTAVYLGLGANLGNREANLRMALSAMTRMARVEAVSALYETDPVGGPPQPPFYNAACAIDAGLDPLPLLRFLRSIEEEVGRRPSGERMGPRPIDIDILLYGDVTLDDPQLTLPHPRLHERAFVLVPLAEIATDVRHPVLGRRIADLAAEAGSTGVRRVAERGWDSIATREERSVLGRGPAV